MKAKEFIIENKKDRKAKKYNIKPRNPMGTAPQTGAGAHKDKKKADKQGDVKHKGKQFDEGVAEDSNDIVAVIDGVRSDRTYNDKDHAHNSLGKLVSYGKAKVAELYINGEKVEHFEIGKKYIDFEPKKLDSNMSERIRDPEDWDEGNTEPPNNFAVTINGKQWKVFQGHGYYADDEREMNQYYKLKDWARKKSEATGKKWEVFRTGAPATP